VSGPLILAVESSCDETGIAVVEGGRRIHANVVASQTALHAATGGIVPEVAARAHLRWIVPVLDEALADAGITVGDVDAVAVTYGPGLAGSLLVGINFAKTLAFVHDKPLVGVNHLEGHLYAAWLLDPGEAEREAPLFPLVALIVSGGHTFLVEMPDHLTYRLLGQTVDDAAGEAFDKVGRLLGLPYPGGPAIQRAAEDATRHDAVFPRAWLGDSYDFSFSGLKTAARRTVDEARTAAGLPVGRGRGGAPAAAPGGAPGTDAAAEAQLPDAVTAELAWGFQDSVVDVLATKTIRAAEEFGARTIVLGGGVAANAGLRARITADAEARNLRLNVPRPGLCTDNGAMIGAAAAWRLEAGDLAGLDLDARPSLPLARREAVAR
jgi:N6-L-threonylcarbamoyladenine synthase